MRCTPYPVRQTASTSTANPITVVTLTVSPVAGIGGLLPCLYVGSAWSTMTIGDPATVIWPEQSIEPSNLSVNLIASAVR